jgi:hypothetical protein
MPRCRAGAIRASGIKPANFSFQSFVPAMRLRGVEQALERAAPLPMIVEIANDPERRWQDPDAAEIKGVIYHRADSEPY